MTKHRSYLAAAATVFGLSAVLSAPSVRADVYNLKVVTDGSPDYSDLDSLVHSTTSRWDADKEKMWALFYWSHIARRQTKPMSLHGKAETDPIRQFNDYGYTMCSTISGINCMIWQHMGYKVKYYDIAAHTVPEVFYDDAWHHYDNSLSVIYTLCDGKTIAGIEDVGKTLGCAASGGKEEAGHIAMYHALNGSGPDGFLEGADTIRDLRHLGEDTFNPKYLKYRSYTNDGERGHRYILNLRDGETYARHYTRLDKPAEGTKEYKSDPAYFTPNGKSKDGKPLDPEAKNPRYRIRGSGVRTYVPPKPAADGTYKVEGANVITSLKITADSAGSIAISRNNGMTWTELPKPDSSKVDLKLIDEVNGAYEVLVKAPDARNIKFETITQINSKTQPKLNVGKNTIYLGAGEQAGSIVLWPELQSDRYKPMAVESVNVKTKEDHEGWNAVMNPAEKGGEGYVVFKIDAPQDLTKITQGARMYVRNPKSSIRFEHSFDGGKTWVESYALTDTEQPWDDIHNQVTTDIPASTKSVLFKYVLKNAGVYSVRMEANHKVAASSSTPLEVTFNWSEPQADYTLVDRSHTQVVDKLPFTYDLNVGGADHPVVTSLTINTKGARGGDVKPGYSDGKDAGGEKWVGKWVTYGTNLAQGKPYTLSVPPSDNQWEAGDPDLKKLTDGRVGSSYSGGGSYKEGPLWNKNAKPEITVDLGESKKAAAFRIHIHGYPGQDAMKGKVKDEVEVLVSGDGKEFKPAGKFDFNLRWKDVPVNYMWTDEELFVAHNHTLALDAPVDARFVRFAVKPSRMMVVTEVQVLDGVKSEPFDLKIALPATNTTAAAK
ncbi:MAG: hypothetical protein WBD40_13615 [Tepidisphaeraceae bacterium]